ncbi:putative 26S proteasome regulatory subunit, variant 2 [Orbilia ellipsospora]|uniref:26S proteasome regulatory subunit, variant 2 n=1 Tax=Orbilia ellipsospora TaxID=2528407 RepID=A0AAV9XEE1_9PEZI
MGRQMEGDIHNPSVGGQAASTSAASNGTSSRDRILSLMKRKEALEAEINSLSAVLDTHGVNMQTPLTTFDGYPRDDIDVAQIRTTRARIIPLVNDMKVLMAEIERALHSYHAEQAGAPEPTGSEDPATASSGPSAPRPETIVEAVFAVVNQVFPSSPAEAAGLKAGDKIKRFGTVGALNHEKLAKVATEVQQNENVRTLML